MRFHRGDAWLGWLLAPMPHEQQPDIAEAVTGAAVTQSRDPAREVGICLAEEVGR